MGARFRDLLAAIAEEYSLVEEQNALLRRAVEGHAGDCGEAPPTQKVEDAAVLKSCIEHTLLGHNDTTGTPSESNDHPGPSALACSLLPTLVNLDTGLPPAPPVSKANGACAAQGLNGARREGDYLPNEGMMQNVQPSLKECAGDDLTSSRIPTKTVITPSCTADTLALKGDEHAEETRPSDGSHADPDRKARDYVDPFRQPFHTVDLATREAANMHELIELKPQWQAPSRVTHSSAMSASSSVRQPAESVELPPIPDEVSRSWWSWMVLGPAHPTRLLWDFLGAAFVGYDLVIIPLSVFPIPSSSFLTAMSWVTMVYWTFNAVCAPVFGTTRKGLLIMRPCDLTINYLKSWFWIDMAILLPDWSFAFATLQPSATQNFGSVRFLRALRLLRMTRLMRLVKLKNTLQNINDMINSEFTSIIQNIIVMLVFLLVIAHYMACGFYLVGQVDQGGWLVAFDLDDVRWSDQYLASIHWAITQFTPSSMQISPTTPSERLYAIGVIVVGLVGFAYLIGSITGSISQIRMMSEDQKKQFWHLRRYCREKQLPRQLAVRIQRYLEHTAEQQKETVQASKIRILDDLSEQLKSELQCATCIPHLQAHPLFDYINANSKVTAQRLATAAVSTKALANSDTAFVEGEQAIHMYFVVSGHLRYVRTWNQGVPESMDLFPRPRFWISEPVLWTKSWVHFGQLVAITESSLMAVDAKMFCQIISLNPYSYSVVASYASKYVAWMLRDHLLLTDVLEEDDMTPHICEFMADLPSFKRDSVSKALKKGRSTQMRKMKLIRHFVQ